MKVGLYLTSCTKIISKYIIELKLKIAKTIKVLEGNLGGRFLSPEAVWSVISLVLFVLFLASQDLI